MSKRLRILFVDDEPMILHALQRILRPMRAEWDMTFVESGERALELMAQQPFDVVVSDMRMPGMSGAELLNQVMTRYPTTIRLILSGHADKDVFLQCVRSTHQFLSKPCEIEALKTTLQRATGLESSLRNEIVQRVVSQMDHLPSVPQVYCEMVEKLQHPAASAEEIGAIVTKDMGMTAKVLKLVNSTFFGLHRQVVHPAEAVAYLGVETLKSLVLALHVFAEFDSGLIPRAFVEALWKHSLETAAGASAIAALESAETKLRDECFVSGMLHDAGKLVLAHNYSEQYLRVTQRMRHQGEPSWVAEQQVFGVNHADVGGYLLGLWGLPVPVVEAIARHHAPGPGASRGFSPMLAVHVANVLGQTRQEATPPDSRDLLDLQSLCQAGLADRLDAWRAALRQNLAQVA